MSIVEEKIPENTIKKNTGIYRKWKWRKKNNFEITVIQFSQLSTEFYFILFF